MSVILFMGPTLSGEEARAVLPEAEVLGPVSQGDVHRAGQKEPRVIGIIDGYFERVTSSRLAQGDSLGH